MGAMTRVQAGSVEKGNKSVESKCKPSASLVKPKKKKKKNEWWWV
jgi:hypothetical protein